MNKEVISGYTVDRFKYARVWRIWAVYGVVNLHTSLLPDLWFWICLHWVRSLLIHMLIDGHRVWHFAYFPTFQKHPFSTDEFALSNTSHVAMFPVSPHSLLMTIMLPSIVPLASVSFQNGNTVTDNFFSQELQTWVWVMLLSHLIKGKIYRQRSPEIRAQEPRGLWICTL